jgi:hypothetical protein
MARYVSQQSAGRRAFSRVRIDRSPHSVARRTMHQAVIRVSKVSMSLGNQASFLLSRAFRRG